MENKDGAFFSVISAGEEVFIDENGGEHNWSYFNRIFRVSPNFNREWSKIQEPPTQKTQVVVCKILRTIKIADAFSFFSENPDDFSFTRNQIAGFVDKNYKWIKRDANKVKTLDVSIVLKKEQVPFVSKDDLKNYSLLLIKDCFLRDVSISESSCYPSDHGYCFHEEDLLVLPKTIIKQ